MGTIRQPDRDDLDRVHASVGEPSWSQLRGKRLFVTGGTGFVGKWLLSTLLDADRRLGLGCRVGVLSRDPAAFARDVPWLAGHPAVEMREGDVRGPMADVGACDLLIHAATDVAARVAPIELFDSCVEGTRRVLALAAAQRTPRVLLVSSGAVYGAQPAQLPAVPETYTGAPDVADPRSAYGQGKRVAEWLAHAGAAEHGFDLRVARCFAFVGPYQPLDGSFAIGNFLRDAMQGRSIVVQGDGSAVRTYLHATDMAAWLWAIALRGASNGVYNVGGQNAISIGELASRITRLLGSTAPVTLRHGAPARLAPSRYVPDVSRALAGLDLPHPLGLDDAVLRTVAWHRADPTPAAAHEPAFATP